MNPHISRSYSAPLHWFALLTALMTLGLILVGGLVTSHGVGMAVPDWPNTYGYNMFLFPIQQWVEEFSTNTAIAWWPLLSVC